MKPIKALDIKIVTVNSRLGINLKALSELLASVGMRPRSKSQMQKAIAASSDVIAAYLGSELVGFCRLISDGVYYGSIWDVAVRPDLQQCGIGSKMISQLISRAHARRLVMIGLFTASQNRQFYERHGFKYQTNIHAMTRFPPHKLQKEKDTHD